MAVAIAVALPAALAFVDSGQLLPARWASALARLQLVPAVLRLPAAGAAITLGALALLTLALGRVYCSTLCPLGTLQDALLRLARPWRKRARRRFRYRRPRTAVHLAVAAGAAAAAALGVLGPLELLEPWTGWGRSLSTLGRPLAAALQDGAAALLARAHVYAVPSIALPRAPWAALAVAAAWLAALAALTAARGRIFCNLLCPAGALLHLLARPALLRVGIDRARCNGCGACERACKAGCIDAAGQRVDHAACIGCFDCLAVCPTAAVGYGRRRPAGEGAAPGAGADPSRRALLRAAVVATGGLLLPPAAGGAAAPDPRDARRAIVPPGGVDARRFAERCTGCQLCVASCPTQVLRPGLLAHGPGALLQPRLVYDAGACVYDCHRCGEVCPMGALAALPLAQKHLVQVGRARFVKDDCVVAVRKKACGACAEHCPTKAVQMVPYQAPGAPPGLRIPELREELCIGCGACEHPCPTRPRRAIWVEARSPHGQARPPEQQPLAAPPAGASDFPF